MAVNIKAAVRRGFGNGMQWVDGDYAWKVERQLAQPEPGQQLHTLKYRGQSLLIWSSRDTGHWDRRELIEVIEANPGPIGAHRHQVARLMREAFAGLGLDTAGWQYKASLSGSRIVIGDHMRQNGPTPPGQKHENTTPELVKQTTGMLPPGARVLRYLERAVMAAYAGSVVRPRGYTVEGWAQHIAGYKKHGRDAVRQYMRAVRQRDGRVRPQIQLRNVFSGGKLAEIEALLGLHRCSGCGNEEWLSKGELARRHPLAITPMPAGEEYFYCRSCAVIGGQTRMCTDCRESYHRHDVVELPGLTGQHCLGCAAQRGYFYCRDCGAWRDARQHGINGAPFIHDGQKLCAMHARPFLPKCESPYKEFALRAFGMPEEKLAADTRLSLTMGGGEIDRATWRRITEFLAEKTAYVVNFDPDYLLEHVGDDWQNKEGNLTKRFAKVLIAQHQIKFSDQMLAEVGNLARQNASKNRELIVDVTRDLNQERKWFVNDASCLWSQYAGYRCKLKQVGGFALRIWEKVDSTAVRRGSRYYAAVNKEGYAPVGRAWVMPLQFKEGLVKGESNADVVAEAYDAEGFLVWNEYTGDRPQLMMARIIAQLTGKTYVKIPDVTMAMYNNNGSGTVVASAEQAEELRRSCIVNGRSFDVNVPESKCDCPEEHVGLERRA